jgi:hypothetical protein
MTSQPATASVAIATIELTYLMAVSLEESPRVHANVACAARSRAKPAELASRSMPEIFGRSQDDDDVGIDRCEPSNEAPSPSSSFQIVSFGAQTRFPGKPLLSVGTRRLQLRTDTQT